MRGGFGSWKVRWARDLRYCGGDRLDVIASGVGAILFPRSEGFHKSKLENFLFRCVSKRD